jgi:flagellin
MGLSVNTNVAANTVYHNLLETNSKISDSLSKLSSGLRVNSAKDDASGYAIANAFSAKISSLKVASQNTTEAQDMLQTADGGYSTINDILVRMKSLATEAASGQSDQSKMTDEFSALQSEIDRTANSTTYNSTDLINTAGSANAITFQVGSGSDATVDQISFQFTDATSSGLGVDKLKIDTTTDASAAMTTIDTALDNVNLAMSKLGAEQNRLQYTSNNLSTSIENYTASESAIRDVDMASEVTSYTANNVLEQTGIAMLAQANQLPQQILSLLK